MPTKEEWIEYFKLLNDREPTDEECKTAGDEGQFTVPQEEKVEVPEGEKLEVKPTKQEWVEFFELTNGRKPTLEEFHQALETGEFSDGSAQTLAKEPINLQVEPTLEPQAIFCGNCGTKAENGTVFCSSCGARIDGNDNATTSTPQYANNEVSKGNEIAGKVLTNSGAGCAWFFPGVGAGLFIRHLFGGPAIPMILIFGIIGFTFGVMKAGKK